MSEDAVMLELGGYCLLSSGFQMCRGEMRGSFRTPHPTEQKRPGVYEI